MDSIYVILIIAISGPIIGSVIGVLKKPSDLFAYNMLAFAAGVMLSISFLRLIPESIRLSSIWLCCTGVTIGSLMMFVLDKITPHIHPRCCGQEQGRELRRTAIFIFSGIFLHNFPEGMAIATGTMTDFTATFGIALAIAIHNIPEGIVTSAPYYYSSGKRLESFLISSSTAIPIIVGYIFARFLFKNIPLDIVGMIIAATAGLMIYISGDELIPMSQSKDSKVWNHSTIFSLIAGVLLVIILGSL